MIKYIPTKNPRSRIAWRNQVILANNANFIGFELNTLGKVVMVFEATPFAANGIYKAIAKNYAFDGLTIEIVKHDTHGNIYHISK